jgi:hypothetical protein
VTYVYGRRRGAAERFGAWLVTGPVGRFLAFFYDAVVAVANGLANRLRQR